MHSARIIFRFGVTALLLQLSSAAPKKAYTEEICVTRRASTTHKGPVPTHSHLVTHTDTCQVYVTKTPTTTITPPPRTTTTTVTVTTTTEIDVLQSTDTFTSTVDTTVVTTTDVPTVTLTSTDTTTVTSTSTAEGTTTVSTPNGFVPIQSSLPGAASKRKRSAPALQERSLSGSLSGDISFSTNKHPMIPIAGTKPSRSYPAEVDCYGYVEKHVYQTKTVTLHKTTKTVTAPTPTSTVSVTTTSTSTKVVTTADASTTVTTTSTSTSTVTNAPTTTFTSTSTATAVVPTYTTTAYAVCSQNNIAGTVMGVGIDTAYSNNNQNFASSNTAASSAQECCNNCAANPLCVSSAFEPQFGPGQQCFLIISTQTTCEFGDYSLNAVINNPPLPADGGYFLTNGNCGRFDTSST